MEQPAVERHLVDLTESFSCDVLARTVSDVFLLVLDSECMLLCVLL